MLVLSRKIGETLDIGEGISVTVCEIRSGSVRLGIDAPHEVEIRRAEVGRIRVRKPTPSAGDIHHAR